VAPMGLTTRRLRGCSRLLIRAPLLLYRLRMGWLYGHRFVYVTHRGRRTGLRRETVLEVVRFDRDRAEVFVVSGWDTRSDWYRNLRSGPPLEVRIGRHRWLSPRCRRLDEAETAQLLDAYRRGHPRAWRWLAPLIGLTVDWDGASKAISRMPTALAFRPAVVPETT
jgi:deazaflavin-dependent oxidoreductase (nitroreductase family)